MPIPAELLADDPVGTGASTAPAFYGKRAALFLGTAMLVALALVTLLRWTGDEGSGLEKVVQQRIPADALTSSPRVDLAAPDPGDAPP